MGAALPAEALPTPLFFGSPLLVSIPGAAIAGLRLPGSLFGAGALREAALPPGLRTAIALVSQEAAARGHRLSVLHQEDLFSRDGRVGASVRSLDLTGADTPWYRVGEPQDQGLESFSAVMMRKDPPFDMEYVYGTYLLDLLED